MAKKKIKDITKKKELPDKETKKVKGGALRTAIPIKVLPDKPGAGETMCICSTKCSIVGNVFGSAQRDTEA